MWNGVFSVKNYLKVSRLPDPLHGADDHDGKDEDEGHPGGEGGAGHEAEEAGGRGQQPRPHAVRFGNTGQEIHVDY